jgi:hypothetical protein
MGLENQISRRKTVAEEESCAEHISILGILEISARNIEQILCCKPLMANQRSKDAFPFLQWY